MPPTTPERYTARICWNSNGWVFPSTKDQKLEKGTFVAQSRFGGEEWLFNFAWLIDGFHYAFLQPVNKSFEKFTGKIINLLLYTIRSKGRFYVGRISQWEVFTIELAETARKTYKKRGWLNSMPEQVENVGGKRSKQKILESEAKYLFNVRFRPDHADIFDPLQPADRNHYVWKRERYTLAIASDRIDKQWRMRQGDTTPQSLKIITRKGTLGVTYDPLHPRLQADLLSLLQTCYGKSNVMREEVDVDITVRDGKRSILIEIKTDPSPRAAIREAIGQILEYAYHGPQPRTGSIEKLHRGN